MNRTAKLGIAALVLFLIVGIGVQFQTLAGVITGSWARGFSSFVMLAGRFAFAMFAVDLFRRKKVFAGVLGIVASLVIAWMEWKLIGLHTESMEYLVFARGFVGVSMLIEVMLSIYISGLEVETEAEKEPETAQAKPERTTNRKRKVTGKKPEVRRQKLAEILQTQPEITQAELAEKVGASVRTVRSDLKLLNGSTV